MKVGERCTVDTLRGIGMGWRTVVLLLISMPSAVWADDASAQAPPKESFLTSLKQAFKSDFEHEVVRGHFEVGTAPDVRRYYCLVDAKTGKREPSGVSGELEKRKDGMTGVKPGAAVALFSCDSAEQQGILVTTGYMLIGGAAAGAIASKPAVTRVPSASVAAEPEPAGVPPGAVAAPESTLPVKVDVAGIRLSMSPDEVRAQLKSKKLLDFYESAGSLGEGGKRYVNVMTAWTTEPVTGDEKVEAGESYQVMFTPVPAHERVMAVIHTTAYASAGNFKEPALQAALAKKYGAGGDLSSGSTWRVQGEGVVQIGDACHRRTLYGGLVDVINAPTPRPNGALKTTPDEFRYQIERCGVAIITEDHSLRGTAADAVVARITVSAYSPSIAFEGSTTAAQLMQSGGGRGTSSRGANAGIPSL